MPERLKYLTARPARLESLAEAPRNVAGRPRRIPAWRSAPAERRLRNEPGRECCGTPEDRDTGSVADACRRRRGDDAVRVWVPHPGSASLRADPGEPAAHADGERQDR